MFLVVVLVFGLVLPVRQLWDAWRSAYPGLDGGDGSFSGTDGGFPAWLPALGAVTLLLWLATPAIAIATLVLASNAVADRSKAVGRWLVVLGLLLAAWIVLPFVTTAVLLGAPDDNEAFGSLPPGPGEYLFAAGIQLLVLAGIAAIVLAVIGPRAFRPREVETDQAAPPGWYLDPVDDQSWHWWDGRAWVPSDQE